MAKKNVMLVAALLTASASCGPLGESSLEVFEPQPVETPYVLGPNFASVLYLLRQPSDDWGCSTDCHTDVTLQNQISFQGGDQKVYDEIIEGGTAGSAVYPTDPALSALVVKITQAGPGQTNSHPRQPMAAGSDEYEAIRGWIALGATFD